MNVSYTGLYSQVVVPLYEQANGHSSVAIRAAMVRSHWLPAQELNAFQVRWMPGNLTQAVDTEQLCARRYTSMARFNVDCDRSLRIPPGKSLRKWLQTTSAT